MRRSVVFSVAGVALAAAALLTIFGVGDDPAALTDGQAFVLGIVQGLTELLPISSSGHLILVPWGADWTYLEQHDRFNQTFDVALHLGTLVAVGAYFWGDIVRLVRAWLHSRGSAAHRGARRAGRVVRARRHHPCRHHRARGRECHRRPPRRAVADPILLSAGALLLYWADRSPQTRSMGDLGLRQALVMGFAQALALAPGVSRSGITITAGRFMSLDRDGAARFSFFLLDTDRSRRSLLKGLKDVVSGTSRRLDRAVPRRHARCAREAASSRSNGSSATSADTRTASSSPIGSSSRPSSWS